MSFYVGGLISLLTMWLLIGAWRLRKRRVTIGPAAAATMTDLLDDQRRAAVEIILEEKTGERDAEDRDGNSGYCSSRYVYPLRPSS